MAPFWCHDWGRDCKKWCFLSLSRLRRQLPHHWARRPVQSTTGRQPGSWCGAEGAFGCAAFQTAIYRAGRQGNKKSLRPYWPQGRSYIRGTTLITSIYNVEVTSDSNKSYPCNGGIRVPLLSNLLFTEPTRESDCLSLLHRFTPTTGSLEHPKQANFPSLSLRYAFLSFNHKHFDLSTGRFPSFTSSFHGKIGKMNIFKSTREKHLTFTDAHVTVSAIQKRL